MDSHFWNLRRERGIFYNTGDIPPLIDLFISHLNNFCPSVSFQDPSDPDMLYVGAGLWQSGKMRPAIIAVRASTGAEVWSWVSTTYSQHGGVRGVIVDGERIIGTGYIESPEPGFLFVADEASPALWELDTSGNMVQEVLLDRDLLPQGAKIRFGLSKWFI